MFWSLWGLFATTVLSRIQDVLPNLALTKNRELQAVAGLWFFEFGSLFGVLEDMAPYERTTNRDPNLENYRMFQAWRLGVKRGLRQPRQLIYRTLSMASVRPCRGQSWRDTFLSISLQPRTCIQKQIKNK